MTPSEAVPMVVQAQDKKLELEVVQGPDAGKCVRAQAEGESVTVGTAADSTLVLSDPQVAEKHLKLSADADGVLVVDLGSQAGTLVGALCVHRAVVPTGSAIRIGSTTLRVSLSAASDAEPSSALMNRNLTAVAATEADAESDTAEPDPDRAPPSSDIRMLGTDLSEDIFDLPYHEARSQVLGVFEAKYLKRLLEKTRGNVSAAARAAKMDRSYLIKLRKKQRSAS